MNEIIILIKKDLFFSLKFIVLSFLYNCLFCFAIPEPSNLQEITLIAPPLMLFAGIIVRMSYIEDKYSTITFLKALPIARELIVKEK